ncbi:hypothetical protein ACHAWF_001192, partial [Thalassiosira exigua]
AFVGCKSLTRICIPPTVDEIGVGAFQGCWDLVEMELCEGLRKIGDQSILYCFRVKHITLPSTITEIGVGAFSGCSSLNEVVALCKGLQRIGIRAFSGCRSLERITIPSTAVEIGDQTFQDCMSLRAIEFGEEIHHIGKAAFQGCDSLLGLEIPPNAFVIEWGEPPSCSFVGKRITAPLIREWSPAQTIISGILGILSPQRYEMIQERIDAIISQQNETMEEKVEMIRAFIDPYKMIDATTNLELAIRNADIDVRGDISFIIVKQVLRFLRSGENWVYL